jgi:heat shock protein HtpX
MVGVGLGVFTAHAVVALAGLAVLGWLFADPPGLVTIVLALLVGVVVAGYIGYRMNTLRLVASLQAQQLSRGHAPELYRRLERLCGEMDVTQPPVFVADLGAPNALSIGGPQRGAVVVDQSLVQLLTIDELEGILAHELAHLESYDTFLNTLAITAMRTLVGVVFLFLFPVVLLLAGVDRATAWIAGRPRWRPGVTHLFRLVVLAVLGLVLGPLSLAYLAHARKQEYAADRRAAEATGKPVALARALGKIHRANDPRSGLLSTLYTHDDRSEQRRLFSTHPPLEDRIDRLLDRVDHGRQAHYVGRIYSP